MLFCVKNFPVLTINKLSVHKYSRLSFFLSYFFQALMFWRIDKICSVTEVDWKFSCIWYIFHFHCFSEYLISHVVIWQDILVCNQFGRLNLNYCINLQIVFFSKSPFFCFCSSLSLYFFISFSPDWRIYFQLIFDNFDIFQNYLLEFTGMDTLMFIVAYLYLAFFPL